MRKFSPALLLPALLLSACGGNDLNQAKRSDERQALAQAQVCPPGKFSDSELRCTVQTNPVQISVPAPEGWSVYWAGWMQQEDTAVDSSQTGFSSIIQDAPDGSCRSMIDINVGGTSSKTIAEQEARLRRLAMKGSKMAQTRAGWGGATRDGSRWMWMITAGEPVLFVASPLGRNQTLDWRLSIQSIKLDDNQLSKDECPPTGSPEDKLALLRSLISKAKVSS